MGGQYMRADTLQIHLLMLLFALTLPITGHALAKGPPDERFDLRPEDNLALGRPYTFSHWPHFKSNMGRAKDNFMTMLTDGKYASVYTPYNRYFFSLVPEAVSFHTEGAVSVTVDLGAVHPVAEILCRHDSSGNATAQPRREEYFASLDGKNFYRVGQRRNTFDPKTIIDDSYRTAFYGGTKVWSSGPLTLEARYVRIKTYPVGYIDVPPFASNIKKAYVGYDEIAVRKGTFDLSEAKLDTSLPEPDLEAGLPVSILGYALNPPPFHTLFKEGPMEVFTFPMGVFGDPAYHLSIDGPYILMFKQITNGKIETSDFRFTLWLPETLTALDPPNNWKITTTQETRNGKPYQKIVLAWEDPRKRKQRDDRLPFLTLMAKQKTPGDLGSGYFSWSYTHGEKRYTAKERTIAFKLDPRIDAPRPKRFINGEWQPRKTIGHKASTIVHFQNLYKDTGFNALLTAYRKTSEGPAKYQYAKQLGFSVYHVSLVCPNGLAFKYYNKKWYDDHPAHFRFQYHPRYIKSTPENVQSAMCPHALASKEFEPLLVEALRGELETADHVYVNWEPYYYMKRGCICEACKDSFQSFTKMSAEEVDEVWPDIVTDRQSKVHNRFASWQHGNLVIALE